MICLVFQSDLSVQLQIISSCPRSHFFVAVLILCLTAAIPIWVIFHRFMYLYDSLKSFRSFHILLIISWLINYCKFLEQVDKSSFCSGLMNIIEFFFSTPFFLAWGLYNFGRIFSYIVFLTKLMSCGDLIRSLYFTILKWVLNEKIKLQYFKHHWFLVF